MVKLRCELRTILLMTLVMGLSWFPVAWANGSHTVEVKPDQHVTNIDFGNAPTGLGGIGGTKWKDLNNDGKRQDGEPGLAGVTIYLDLNENGVFDKGEPYQVTDEQGKYKFTNLDPGTYVVREVVPDGYRQTFPNSSSSTTTKTPNQATWTTTANSLRGNNEKLFTFVCPSNGTASTLWGEDIYTDDSSVCTAAVHAGLISISSGGAITIEIRPGANSYSASTRNGVTSRSYDGSWDGSFILRKH